MINSILIILIILLIVILVFAFYLYYNSNKKDLIYVKSKLDNEKYQVYQPKSKKDNAECINDKCKIKNNDSEEAAYILSILKKRAEVLRDYLYENREKYPEFKPYIEQLKKKLENIKIIENPPNGEYTSYTINKGEEIAVCLRSSLTENFHDLNIITYVIIHELAHVACPEINHTELFKKIFVFLLKISVQLNIYSNNNYQENPEEYCGITINEKLLHE